MKKRKFSDFIFGLAYFSSKEGFTDEFIRRCSENKALIFDLKINSGEITGSVHFSDIALITDAAEKSGMELTITKRYGLPHIFYRYRRRYGIPAGLFIFILIIAVLRSVIWSIDITPTEFIAEEEIYEALEEAGAGVGVFSSSVSCKDAEYLLYEKFDGISWVNVRIVGTRMFVDISEVKVKEKVKEERYTNIVATKDGEIVNAEILRGEAILYPGTAVVRGDLLISGIINHRDGSVKFVDSEGKIFARTKNYISSSIPHKLSVNRLKSCKDIYLPVFFGLSLDDIFNVKDSSFTKSEYFILGGDVIFPLGIVREHLYTFAESEIELSENQSALICFRDFSALCLKLYSNAEILQREIKLNNSSGAVFSGSFLTIEDIGEKKEFTVEETGPSR